MNTDEKKYVVAEHIYNYPDKFSMLERELTRSEFKYILDSLDEVDEKYPNL